MSLTPWTYTEFMTPALQCRRFMLDESTKRFFNEKREWRALPLVSTLVWKRPGEAHSPVDHSNTWRSLPLTSTGEWNVHLSFCSASILFKACCPQFHPLANWMYTVREIKLCFSSSSFFLTTIISENVVLFRHQTNTSATFWFWCFSGTKSFWTKSNQVISVWIFFRSSWLFLYPI